MKVIDVSLIALEKALEISEADFAAAQKRIAALEAENAALREFVAAVDDGWRSMPAELGLEPSESESAIRQRLATEHGLPLPEVER